MNSPGSREGAEEEPARTPRQPSSILIVDANIILSVVLGRRSRPVFEAVTASRLVATSEQAAEEVRGVLRDVPDLPADAVEIADALLEGIEVIDQAIYEDLKEGAARALEQAVSSNHGSVADAHLLACAWAYDADLLSHDRDFAGSGWPSWSNRNLRAALQPDAGMA